MAFVAPAQPMHASVPSAAAATIPHTLPKIGYPNPWPSLLLGGAVGLAQTLISTHQRNKSCWPHALSHTHACSALQGLLFALKIIAVALCTALVVQDLRLDLRLIADATPWTQGKVKPIDGLNVHYLEAQSDSSATNSVACLFHGFGASSLSWDPVYKRLAQFLGAKVFAPDLPAFGFTQRPPLFQYSRYSLAYHRRIAESLFEQNSPTTTAHSRRYFLFGHSYGARSAVASCANLPPEQTSLVLVSPALTYGTKIPTHTYKYNPIVWSIPRIPIRMGVYVAQWLWWFTLFVPCALLRRAVYAKGFWRNGLRPAWFDPSKVTTEVTDRYSLPGMMRGWDRGILEFTFSRLVEEIRACFSPDISAGELLTSRITAGMKVLIIHGQNDSIIPVSLSQRLADQIGAPLVVLPQCGHVPQEEQPDAFLEVVSHHISPSDT